VVQARAELDAAMGRLRDSLRKDPDYTAALNDKQAAQAQVTALHASGDASPEQVLPLAQRGLADGQRIAQIEREAIAKDADVIAARAHLAAAMAAHNAQAQADGVATPAAK
jgi:hypothetical protein